MVMDDISALMDGELDGAEAQRQIMRMKGDPELRERWESFHVIGDAMRGQGPLSPGFSASFSKRLQDEPTVLAPYRSPPQLRRITTYALSAAASICAIGFVAWVAGPVNTTDLVKGPEKKTTPTSIASQTLPVTSVSSDGHMNEYLLAHQGFSPSTAIQGLAPYIRSVSATRAPEGR
jgi:sigma-E factor negative regulatory protein RseA